MSTGLCLIFSLGFLFLSCWYLREKSLRKTHPMPGGIDKDRFIEHNEEWLLYHNSFSLCSKKTRMCLSEFGISYESREIDLIETGSYETLSREFLKVNPSGLLPVLVHKGHPIYESHDQLAYITEHSPNPYLLTSRESDKKALMDQWVEKTSLLGDDPTKALAMSAANAVAGLTFPIFAAMIENIPYKNIFVGVLFHREKIRPFLFILLKLVGLKQFIRLPPLRTILRDSQKALHKHLDRFESDLDRYPGPWLLGEQFSLADVGMVAILERLKEGDWLGIFLIETRPNLARYWRHVQMRKSYQDAVVGHEHPLVTQATNDIAEAKTNPSFWNRLVAL